MLYNPVSIDEVVARVLRNTRVQDMSYIQDMMEWVPEAMTFMRTEYELSREFKDVEINFHKGKLPCGLVYIDAVEYDGHRLSYSSTSKHYSTGHNLKYPSVTNAIPFASIVKQVENGENNLWVTQTVPYYELPIHNTAFYNLELGWITTSFADGCVRLHYRLHPLDENGMPLIPDNESYKEAIYYYVRAKMIGAGYEDKVYREGELMNRFETYARRAINEITYPTPDEKEQQVKTQVRFIPPDNYWENFFRVDHHERPYYP